MGVVPRAVSGAPRMGPTSPPPRRPPLDPPPPDCAQVRVGFALTINKAQGQTLKRVGIYLETECFGHGQLYVAASRVGDPAWLRFALDPNDAGEYRTKNVVYAEALTSLMCGECECE